ncbi:MAG: hypothetical protein JWN04_1311 [Myxococcaceae bacterium]|nr:hypothetical protein [Myxococcaceae bacterium]
MLQGGAPLGRPSGKTRRVWPLFVGIGVGFLLLLSFGWGLGTGVKLGKKSHSREPEAYRAVAEGALEAHCAEREAWLGLSLQAEQHGVGAAPGALRDRLEPGPESVEAAKAAAERAHQRTRAALLALRSAWAEGGVDDARDAAKSGLERADSRSA